MDERQFVAVTPFLRDMAYVSLVLIGPVDADDAAQEALAVPLGVFATWACCARRSIASAKFDRDCRAAYTDRRYMAKTGKSRRDAAGSETEALRWKLPRRGPLK